MNLCVGPCLMVSKPLWVGDQIVKNDVLVLMYHAIPKRAGDVLVGADEHYSIALSDFTKQLDVIADLSGPPTSVRNLLATPRPGPSVAITFDDGHETNFDAILAITGKGGSAELFVNPTTVGTPGFLTWNQLRELSSLGASVQSHCLNHVFLDELSPEEVWTELVESKQRIEDNVGAAVTILAPPNGRMPARLVQTAQRAGYSAVCSSRAGLWNRERVVGEIPRIAMQGGTSLATLASLVRMEALPVLQQRLRFGALAFAKKALGKATYLRIRQALLSQPGS